MKQLKFKILLLFSAIALLGISFESAATHLIGGQITYTYVSGSTYQVTLTIYRDCDGISLSSSAFLNVDGPTPTSVNLPRIAINNVTVLCPGQTSTCSGGSVPGIEEHVYRGNVTLGTAGIYTFSYSDCCRNSVITTGSADDGFFLSAQLNTLLAPGNSSPNFLNAPIGKYCTGSATSIGPNGSDPNGDVIIYSLVNARASISTSVNYIPPFSGTNPLTSSTGVSINPNTGEISFTPTAQEIPVLAFKAEEYRVINGNSTKIGEVVREIQLEISACAGNTPPVLSAVPNAIVQVGQAYCVNINATDAATQNISLSAVGSIIPPATFNVTSSGLGFSNSTFCFTPQAIHAGNTFTVSVNAQDDFCPSSATSVRTWNITVPAVCNVSISSSSTPETCVQNDGSATANMIGGTPPYSYSWTGPNNFSSFAQPTISGLPAGTYNVNISDANNCAASASIVVADNCGNNPCGPATVTVTAGGLNALWVNAGASAPNTFYYGVTDALRVNAAVAGGVGPFTYAWSNSGTNFLLPRIYYPASSIDLFRPTAATTITCTVTDQGTGCVYTGTLFVDWDDQFFCGQVGNTWNLYMCVNGQTQCVPWTQARSMLRANPPTATLGQCNLPAKTYGPSATTAFQLYPNPSSGLLTLEMPIAANTSGTIEVMDVNGRALYSEVLNMQEGMLHHSIDLGALPNGIYVVRIATENEFATERIQILR